MDQDKLPDDTPEDDHDEEDVVGYEEPFDSPPCPPR
jgi:hypothetical protein